MKKMRYLHLLSAQRWNLFIFTNVKLFLNIYGSSKIVTVKFDKGLLEDPSY